MQSKFLLLTILLILLTSGCTRHYVRAKEFAVSCGYIDRTGAFALPPEWKRAGNFCKGVAEVAKDGHTYHIDRNSVTVPEDKVDRNCAYRDDELIIKFENNIFDASGKKLIAEKGKNITVYKFSNGLALFSMPMRMIQQYYPTCFAEHRVWNSTSKEAMERSKKSIQYGYLDTEGRIIIPPKYFKAKSFKEGLAEVMLYENKTGLQSGFIDKNDKPLTGAFFAEVKPFTEGYAVITRADGTCSLLHRSGKFTANNLQDAKNVSNGAISVKQNDNWFLMDTDRHLKKRLDYDDVENFNEGLAVVTKGISKGYIDTAGKLVIPLKFMEANQFSEGLAAVGIDTESAPPQAKRKVR